VPLQLRHLPKGAGASQSYTRRGARRR
jgi:hypothetical protein